MVPYRFFWLFDLMVLAVAFSIAYWLAPDLRFLFVPGNLFYVDWIEPLLSPAIWDGILPPVGDILWVPATMTLATLPVLMLSGCYGLLVKQPRTHIIVGSWLAALVGVGMIADTDIIQKQAGAQGNMLCLHHHFRLLAARNIRLVCDDDQKKASFVQTS